MIKEIDDFLCGRFRLKPEVSGLLTYGVEGWEQFCGERCIPLEKEGCYDTETKTVHLLSDAKFRDINLFHEYYGHGTYFEHSFKQGSPMEIEGFALWMEYYLSSLYNIGYSEKFDSMDNASKAILTSFAEYSSCYTDYGLMYSCNFPKYYSKETLKEILNSVYSDIQLALIYGSRQPTSDIDVFMITSGKPLFTEWLDVYGLEREKAEHLIGLLDISVTEALFTGEFVAGDEGLLERLRRKALDSEITQEAISHNLEMASVEKKLGDINGYAESYLKNTVLLAKGIKPLKKKQLRCNGKTLIKEIILP